MQESKQAVVNRPMRKSGGNRSRAEQTRRTEQKIASSPEFVAERWFGELPKLMI